MAPAVNHINIPVDDADETIEFLESVLGLEQIPSINSDAPGAWFQLANAQLHLTERGSEGPTYHHFALDVDDFVAVHDRLDERDCLDEETFGAPLYVLGDGAVQMYFRDPSGNLMEVDHPDVNDLPERIRERARTRAETLGTTANAEATIYPEAGSRGD